MAVHVAPLCDEREHDLTAECWCEPAIEWIDDTNGLPYPNGPLVVHNAADGREFSEEVTGEQVSPEKKWANFVR